VESELLSVALAEELQQYGEYQLMDTKPKPKAMPQRVTLEVNKEVEKSTEAQVQPEVITIEDLDSGEQAMHSTGLEDAPAQEMDEKMYSAIIQASYKKRNKGKKKILPLV
jgi:hypothetical protein